MTERTLFSRLAAQTRRISDRDIRGRVLRVGGLEMTASGISRACRLGDQVMVDERIRGEVVGFNEYDVRILPFGSWEGTAVGQEVRILENSGAIQPDDSWIGKVLDAFGKPLDGDYLQEGAAAFELRRTPPGAFGRRSVGRKLETGIKALDVFVPLCRGQRMGIFAGSGIGKSTLMAMLARQVNADVIVMGLVGERGREVQDFIQNELGPEGMRRTVLVAATSDQPPLTRRQAAWTATAVAEYFRDQGKQVLLMIDSVTRFAMAQREIGLAAGEPPTTRGYTPTVFAEMPRLLERSGPGDAKRSDGDITAIYTVLVDGDDLNEPIADTVRGILDGHIVLDRNIAEAGRYPAINISKSISRMLPSCHVKAERAIMFHARRAMARAADMKEMVSVGVYRRGSDPETDCALDFNTKAEAFMRQDKHESVSSSEAFAALYGLLIEAGIDIPAEEISADTDSGR